MLLGTVLSLEAVAWWWLVKKPRPHTAWWDPVGLWWPGRGGGGGSWAHVYSWRQDSAAAAWGSMLTPWVHALWIHRRGWHSAMPELSTPPGAGLSSDRFVGTQIDLWASEKSDIRAFWPNVSSQRCVWFRNKDKGCPLGSGEMLGQLELSLQATLLLFSG